MGFKGLDFEDNVFGVGSENVKHEQRPIHERDNVPQPKQTRRNNANHAVSHLADLNLHNPN